MSKVLNLTGLCGLETKTQWYEKIFPYYIEEWKLVIRLKNKQTNKQKPKKTPPVSKLARNFKPDAACTFFLLMSFSEMILKSQPLIQYSSWCWEVLPWNLSVFSYFVLAYGRKIKFKKNMEEKKMKVWPLEHQMRMSKQMHMTPKWETVFFFSFMMGRFGYVECTWETLYEIRCM